MYSICSFWVAEIIMISFSSSRWIIKSVLHIFVNYKYIYIYITHYQAISKIVKAVRGDFLRSLVDRGSSCLGCLATTNHEDDALHLPQPGDEHCYYFGKDEGRQT